MTGPPKLAEYAHAPAQHCELQMQSSTIVTRMPTLEDRLAAHSRPDGSPIMHQSWGKLLFMHWQVPVEILREHIPERLTIDTFEGAAWISVTPFTVWGARPVYTPRMPWLSRFHEINVRTYVHHDGVPGVWFFSLNANSALAVIGARTLFGLPYRYARIMLDQTGRTIVYSVQRKETNSAPSAEFRATWTVGADRPRAKPGSLDFFLVERYCLYTAPGSRLYRCRIYHEPWPLQEVRVSSFRSTIVEADGLPTPAGEPLLHHGGPVHVEVWPLEVL